MMFKDLSKMFHRALEDIFNLQKFVPLFLVLLFSGLIFLFFQGFALYAPAWLKFPLFNIPFYFLGFLLMVVGSGICRAHIHKNKFSDAKSPYAFSKESFLKSAYFFAPLLGALFFLTLLMGILMLIKSIAYLGTFLGIILSFAAFLVNFCFLLLLLSACIVLFFFTPLLAQNHKIDKKNLAARLRLDLFTHLIILLVAFFPLWVVVEFAVGSLFVTLSGYSAGDREFIKILQGLFMVIPFAAILSFPLIFFFNFASEAYMKMPMYAAESADNRFVQENASDAL